MPPSVQPACMHGMVAVGGQSCSTLSNTLSATVSGPANMLWHGQLFSVSLTPPCSMCVCMCVYVCVCVCVPVLSSWQTQLACICHKSCRTSFTKALRKRMPRVRLQLLDACMHSHCPFSLLAGGIAHAACCLPCMRSVAAVNCCQLHVATSCLTAELHVWLTSSGTCCMLCTLHLRSCCTTTLVVCTANAMLTL